MKAVKGYTKTIILQSAKRKRAERSLISNQCAKLSNILQNSCRVLQKEAVARIINDTNCDWVFFEDESVIFRYYGKGYDETIINEMRENGYGA